LRRQSAGHEQFAEFEVSVPKGADTLFLNAYRFGKEPPEN
jgi:hypothetical protein